MNIEQVAVHKLPITLAQFLKWTGAALTGGQAKELVQSGQVQLNGRVCEQPGKQLKPGDLVALRDCRWQLTAAE